MNYGVEQEQELVAWMHRLYDYRLLLRHGSATRKMADKLLDKCWTCCTPERCYELLQRIQHFLS